MGSTASKYVEELDPLGEMPNYAGAELSGATVPRLMQGISLSLC